MFSLKLRYLKNSVIENIYQHRQLIRKYSHYNNKIEVLVNHQIQSEQQAAQDYLNMAVTFLHPLKCLQGAGGYFMNMYKEELNHMLEFVQYQMLRGGKPVICGLVPPMEYKSLTLLDAMKQSLSMEKAITKQIEELIKVAEDLKDYHCADFLTTVFMTEQIKSIDELTKHITRLSILNNHIEAVYYYDLKLSQKYPYTFKIT